MRLTRLKLINISAQREYLDEVLEKVVELDEFFPETAEKIVHSVHGAKVLEGENPYETMLKQFKDMGKEMSLKEKETTSTDEVEVDMMKKFMDKNHEQYEEIMQIKKEIELLEGRRYQSLKSS